MRKHYYPFTNQTGYSEIIGAESSLALLGFDLINLSNDETIQLASGDYELGLVVLAGSCTIECAGQRFENLCRKDVFSANPVSVYIPIASDYTVTALGRVEIAVCKVKAEHQYTPFMIKADEVICNQRGQLNWRREVKDIITYKYEGRVDRIVLGETFGYPGQWSSYPSHKHDRDNFPDEVNMEEIYHFRISPKQGFGVQVLYNDDLTLNECYAVRNGDTIAIKEGYHPVAAAPGYQVYYLWVMAGTSGRTLTPNDDPLHAWVKAVEPMVK